MASQKVRMLQKKGTDQVFPWTEILSQKEGMEEVFIEIPILTQEVQSKQNPMVSDKPGKGWVRNRRGHWQRGKDNALLK